MPHHTKRVHTHHVATGLTHSVTAAQVATRLAEAAQHPSHQFWLDTISLLKAGSLKWDEVMSSRYATDAYLLALAVQQGGRFVTLDRGVPLAAVNNATTDHLVVLL